MLTPKFFELRLLVRGRCRFEWPATDEQFVEQAANGVDVGARVDRLPPPLFRRHVRRRSPSAGGLPAAPGAGDRRVGRDQPRVPHHLRQTEVGQFGQVALRHQDVVGLDVAVHEASDLSLSVD